MTKALANEIKLLKASTAGNPKAFETIVANYQSLICAITYSATGSIEQSEEIAHEVFVKAWKDLSKLRELGKFKSWICAITRNTIQNYLRDKYRNPLQRAAPIEAANLTPSTQAEPADSIIAEEDQALIAHLLGQLPEKYREPLVLYYRHDQSAKAVASALEITEETVRQRLRRGRNMLKDRMTSVMERGIAQSGPGKAFTLTVMGSIAALAGKATLVTAAVATPTAIFSTLSAKVLTATVALAIGVGLIVTYHKAQTSDLLVEGETPIPSQSASQNWPTEQAIQVDSVQSPLSTNTGADAPDGQHAQQTAPAQTDVDSTTQKRASGGYEYRPKGVLSGLITDNITGSPVTDATITIQSSSEFHHTKTNEHGFYSFSAIEVDGNYHIVVTSTDYVGLPETIGANLDIHLLSNSLATKHFQLEQACQIKVKVLDEQGLPVQGAEFYVNSLADKGMGTIPTVPKRLSTSEDGTVLIGGIKASQVEYLITATHPASRPSIKKTQFRRSSKQTDLAPGRLRIRLTEPHTIAYGEIVLRKGLRVNGYAEFKDGTPATGLPIVPLPSWWISANDPDEFRVDSQGFFTLEHIVPGSYRFETTVRKGKELWECVNISTCYLPLDNNDLLILTIPENSPQSMASIAGVILFDSDKAIHVYVSARGSSASSFSHRYSTSLYCRPNGTDQETSFSLDHLPPGEYTLNFDGPDIEPITMQNVQAPTSDLLVEVTCTAKPRLLGTVIHPDTGKPCTQFQARAVKLKSLDQHHHSQPQKWINFSNDMGQFDITAIGPGLYEIQVKANGFPLIASDAISTDENRPITISLQAGGHISGRVVDEAGDPVTGATVIPLSSSGSTGWRNGTPVFASTGGSVQTQAGLFRLNNLPCGLETLKITHPNYCYALIEDIEVKRSKATSGIEVALTKGAILEGYVCDNDGSPAPHTELKLMDQSAKYLEYHNLGELTETITNDEGYYRVSNLPETLVYVARADEYQATGVVAQSIVPDRHRINTLNFGGSPVLSGQLVIDGLDLAHTRLKLESDKKVGPGVLFAQAKADIDGYFEFAGTIPGQYTISYQASKESHIWLIAEHITMGDTDLNLGPCPQQSSTIHVDIHSDTQDSEWKISDCILQESAHLYGPRIGFVQAVNDDGQIYTIKGVPAGEYTLVVRRNDGLMLNSPITIEPGTSRIKHQIITPKGAGSVSGHITNKPQRFLLVLQNTAEDLIARISPGENGYYQITSLPLGRYSIRLLSYPEPRVLKTFELQSHDMHTVDADAK